MAGCGRCPSCRACFPSSEPECPPTCWPASRWLAKAAEHLRQRQVRLVLSYVLGPVRVQLDRYGISAAVGGYYETPGEALEAFHAAAR